MAELLLLNGPNLNLLGSREPERYGQTTLAELEAALCAQAERAGHRLTCFQSNHEGALIDRIHAASGDGVLHPDQSGRTDPYQREPARCPAGVAIPFTRSTSATCTPASRSVITPTSRTASGTITGLGVTGYRLALDAAIAAIEER
jgi:3-dehydroquinate dehydratase II